MERQGSAKPSILVRIQILPLKKISFERNGEEK